MSHDPNSVPASMVQTLTQSHADFAYAANRLYDAQLDLARDAQQQLREAQERIHRMEHALIIADEQLRQIDEGHMTKANQVHLDRALDTIRLHLPTEIPF